MGIRAFRCEEKKKWLIFVENIVNTLGYVIPYVCFFIKLLVSFFDLISKPENSLLS